MRVIYIHGNNATHWNYSWASRLKFELENIGVDVFFETFPDSVLARSQYWLPFLRDHVGANEHDVIVGRSTGAVAAMRYAEPNKIAGSVLIAPRYTDLGDEGEKQSGYFDTPWDWQSIKNNQSRICMLTAANDPYIPQSEFDEIARQLQPMRTHLSEGGHFSGDDVFPTVLDAVQGCVAFVKQATA